MFFLFVSFLFFLDDVWAVDKGVVGGVTVRRLFFSEEEETSSGRGGEASNEGLLDMTGAGTASCCSSNS